MYVCKCYWTSHSHRVASCMHTNANDVIAPPNHPKHPKPHPETQVMSIGMIFAFSYGFANSTGNKHAAQPGVEDREPISAGISAKGHSMCSSPGKLPKYLPYPSFLPHRTYTRTTPTGTSFPWSISLLSSMDTNMCNINNYLYLSIYLSIYVHMSIYVYRTIILSIQTPMKDL